MKVKSVLFKVKIKGSGIVNFDSNEQKNVFFEKGHASSRMKQSHDNVAYAKKVFLRKENDELDYKIAISSDCLRFSIFRDDMISQNPSIIHDQALFYSFIASQAMLLRGCMFADKKITYKRKSPVTITKAIQTDSDNAVSSIDTDSRSGQKNMDTDVTDNSFYKKESIGYIDYESLGVIDLEQLQYVSVDPIFDRQSFDPDNFELYSSFLKPALKGFSSELGYYRLKTSSDKTPEYGFILSNDNVNILIKKFFLQTLGMFIKRKDAFAKTTEIYYKLVYDPIEDTIFDENGWVKIQNRNDVNNINIDSEEFFEEVNMIEAEALRKSLIERYNEKKKKNAEALAIKKEAQRKAKEAKKAEAKTEQKEI